MIRRWLKSDDAAIAAIEKESFSTPWSKEMLDGSVDQANFYGLVEEIDGKIVGYVGSAFDLWEAEILLVCVSEGYRRRGIAERLMRETVAHLKAINKEKVFLEVAIGNAAAQSLYFKLGFERIAVRERYYEDTEDALVLALSLKEK